jgi:hypothetical protein
VAAAHPYCRTVKSASSPGRFGGRSGEAAGGLFGGCDLENGLVPPIAAHRSHSTVIATNPPATRLTFSGERLL